MSTTQRATIAPFEPGTFDSMPHWATRMPGIPIRSRMVLVTLVTFDKPGRDHRRKGYVTPSLRTLAALLGTNHGHIREDVAELERLGLVTVEVTGSRQPLRVWLNYGKAVSSVKPPVPVHEGHWYRNAEATGTDGGDVSKLKEIETNHDAPATSEPPEGPRAGISPMSRLAIKTKGCTPIGTSAESLVFTSYRSYNELSNALLDLGAGYLTEEAWTEIEAHGVDRVAEIMALLRARIHRAELGQCKPILDVIPWLRWALRNASMGMSLPADITAFAEVNAAETEARIESWVARHKADRTILPPLDVLDEVIRRSVSPEEYAEMERIGDEVYAELLAS